MNPANVNEFFPDVAAQTKCTLSLDIENFFWRTYPVSEKDEATRERSRLLWTTAVAYKLGAVLRIVSRAFVLNTGDFANQCSTVGVLIHG
jgi:hypothetical protein